MSGSSTIPALEIAQGYSLTVPGPIDDRTIISEVANIAAELPAGVRYPGLLVWVENADIDGDDVLDNHGAFYLFNNGILDTDFISLRTYVNGSGVSNTAISYVYSIPIPPSTVTQLAHNLSSENLQVELYDENTSALIDWRIPAVSIDDPVYHLNVIEILNDVQIESLKAVITFVGTIVSDPISTPESSSDPLYKSAIKNISDTYTHSIQANTKLESIDYHNVSGTPTVKCGTTIGGDEIHTERPITSSATEVLHSIYDTSMNIYFTVTGSGIIDININQRQNIF